MLNSNLCKCKLCKSIFTPRTNGGSPQKFCTKKCKNEFERYCKQYSNKLLDNNYISIKELKNLDIENKFHYSHNTFK